MTIAEAITRADDLKPNQYTESEKIAWLSQLDGTIKGQIIDTHEGGEEVTFPGYDDNTDISTVLLVPAPFDRIYISWLHAMYDYSNGEFAKFNNSNMVYSSDYAEYERYYNRSHMPLGKKMTYF